MVIVMITGDFLSMSLTTDNVRPSQKPNAWSIGRLTSAGVILGVCLLSFCTGVLAVGKFGLHLGNAALQALAFIVLVFGSQGTIYAIRERRHLWNSRPSLLLAASSIVDIAIASTLAVAGIAMAPIPALVVAGTLAAAVLFALVLDLIKVPVFAHLGIAESATTSDTGRQTKSSATPATPSASEPTKRSKTETAAKPENKSDSAVATSSDATPQLVKRVHQLYDALGREDVRAVQDWDKAQEQGPAEKQ
jgi:hypothetical protein